MKQLRIQVKKHRDRLIAIVDNREYKFDEIIISYSGDELKLGSAIQRINLIFDAMNFNIADGRISVSNGVFKSLKDQFGE